mmetsp:Transcript_48292/g.61950  ORF Transcript_48292/g.61950 Transcript_48292/m.61950 type:complete len:129 (+) Transcript_48292:2-388(+)
MSWLGFHLIFAYDVMTRTRFFYDDLKYECKIASLQKKISQGKRLGFEERDLLANETTVNKHEGSFCRLDLKLRPKWDDEYNKVVIDENYVVTENKHFVNKTGRETLDETDANKKEKEEAEERRRKANQ